MKNKKVVQAEAWVRWEVAAERMTLELAPPLAGIWKERPRDLKGGIAQARAALDEVEAAHGLRDAVPARPPASSALPVPLPQGGLDEVVGQPQQVLPAEHPDVLTADLVRGRAGDLHDPRVR